MRVALCVTGAPRMNPDALPVMARHLHSHVVRPWAANVFLGIEVLGTAAESAMLEAAATELGPIHTTVYCPVGGCNASFARWCGQPSCELLTAPVPKGPPFLREHCSQKLRLRASFELMSLKRQRCFGEVLNHEQLLQQRLRQHWQYEFVAYARPDLFHLSPRRAQDLALVSGFNGVHVNGGDCAGEYQRQTQVWCANKSATDDRQKLVRECSPASDHMAVMHRRFAPGYFSAADLITGILGNKSYMCNTSFGTASGICECSDSNPQRRAIGLQPECMLSSWLTEQAIPWGRYSWSTALARGLDTRGMVVVDTSARGDLPAHCTVISRRNSTWMARQLLDQLLYGGRKPRQMNWDGPIPKTWAKWSNFNLPPDAFSLYRASPKIVLTKYVRCDPSSPHW